MTVYWNIVYTVLYAGVGGWRAVIVCLLPIIFSSISKNFKTTSYVLQNVEGRYVEHGMYYGHWTVSV